MSCSDFLKHDFWGVDRFVDPFDFVGVKFFKHLSSYQCIYSLNQLIFCFFSFLVIIFISSNYLFVSDEHRVRCNTNVCSRFCCTTHSFHAFGYSSLLPYMGSSVFILVFRRECVPMQRWTLRLSVLWHNFIGSLFLSTYTILHTLFGFLPVPCVHCCGFRDCDTPQRSTLCL